MPSTYTTNNGIELIATGEQSGTWGDTTNTNLSLIDTALDGQVTITLPAAGSSGSPNALAISDGAASNGRNRLIIFTDGGDLGATAFVQLTPNDAEKIVYIRNNLSGGRAITLFQGTYNASNDYEVPAGTTAVVYFDGAGAGAVAANVFNNAFFDSLRLGGVSVTAILDEDNMASDSATALATQQSIKAYVDAQVGANNELSEVLANGNTSGGNDIQMTTTDEVQFRDTALTISSSVDGQLDIAADVELEIVAPTLDINASTAVTIDTTTLTMTGSVNVVGDLDVDNININGNTIISTDTNGNIALTPNGTGEVDITKVDIDGGTIDGTTIGGASAGAITGTTITGTSFVTTGDMTFGDNDKAIFGAGSDLQIYHDASLGQSRIQDVGTGSLYLQGDGGVVITDSAGTSTSATFASTGATSLSYNGTTKFATTGTGIDVTGTVTADGLTVVQNSASLFSSLFQNAGTGTVELRLAPSAYPNDIGSTARWASIQAINEGAGNPTSLAFLTNPISEDPKERLRIASNGDISFYEDTGTTAKFFWDASAERLGIGTSSVGAPLEVLAASTSSSDIAFFSNSSGVQKAVIRLDAGGDGEFVLRDAGNNEDVVITSGGDTYFNGGNVGIGTSSPSQKLDIVGDATSAAIELKNNLGQGLDLTGGSSGVGIVTPNSLPITFSTSATERMRITSTGSVGIGTSSPGYSLDVQTASGTTLARFKDTDSTYDGIIIAGDTNAGWVGNSAAIQGEGIYYQNSANLMRFYTASAERMRITSTGNVGIGTTSPANILTVFKTSSDVYSGATLAPSGVGNSIFIDNTDNTVGSFGQIVFRNGSSGQIFNRIVSVRDASSQGSLAFVTGSSAAAAERLRITSTGSVGIGTSSPVNDLHVSSTSSTKAVFERTGSTGSYINLKDSSGSNVFLGVNGGTFEVQTAGSAYATKLAITSTGNVGIGTSSPARTLSVNGVAGFGNGTIETIISFSDRGIIGTQSNHALELRTNGTERARIDASGNLLLAGTGTPASSVGNLVLYNGTAPTGNATNGVILYAEDVSASSELKVRDEAGNVTTLSPHNFDLIPEGPSEDMAWSYYSERDGKRINVDMLKAIRLLEQISGEKLVHMT